MGSSELSSLNELPAQSFVSGLIITLSGLDTCHVLLKVFTDSFNRFWEHGDNLRIDAFSLPPGQTRCNHCKTIMLNADTKQRVIKPDSLRVSAPLVFTMTNEYG